MQCVQDRSTLFFPFLFDSPVVPTPPIKSSSSSCSMGCGRPYPSLTHAFIRKVLTECPQVPWLCPGPVEATSYLLLAVCPLCVLNECFPARPCCLGRPESPRARHSRHPLHSFLLRIQAVLASPAEVWGLRGKGRAASGPATRADFLFSPSGKENIFPSGFTP